MNDLRETAERRFREALERQGARDPRDHYREQLKALRQSDPAAYEAALAHFETRLLPEVAREDGDPIAAWLEYGRVLATLRHPGETVVIDPGGRSRPYSMPVAADALVLHLPDSAREPAVAIGLPAELSPAQRATFDLLVRRKTG